MTCDIAPQASISTNANVSTIMLCGMLCHLHRSAAYNITMYWRDLYGILMYDH